MKDYKDLDVFKQSRILVKDVYTMSASFPKEEVYGLTSQIRRSAVSILSNIAEGMGRQHSNDKIHFLHISRGSLYELEAQLLIASDLQYLNPEHSKILDEQIQTSRKLLNGFINYIKERNHAK
jgi:four helix bundle protein